MLEGDSKIFRKKPEHPTFHSWFSEWVISAVRADIRMALMKCLLGWWRDSDIRISEGYIYYQDLEWQNLKWIQEVIILLETTWFLYKHDQIDTSVLDSQVFWIPSIAEMNNDSNDKKLEYMRFCLSRSFKILLDKLSQKKSITPLTLWLFVKTCLYLQREQVPIIWYCPRVGYNWYILDWSCKKVSLSRMRGRCWTAWNFKLICYRIPSSLGRNSRVVCKILYGRYSK